MLYYLKDKNRVKKYEYSPIFKNKDKFYEERLQDQETKDQRGMVIIGDFSSPK